MIPICVVGLGRSGTTAVMDALTACDRVAGSREYPFEQRYLTHLAKQAVLMGRPAFHQAASGERLVDYADDTWAGWPWAGQPAALPHDPAAWLRLLWPGFREQVITVWPTATHYAEKTPVWVPQLVEPVAPCHTLYLFRDPRDVFLSANQFMARTGHHSFSRHPGDSDGTHALAVAHEFATAVVNWQAHESARPPIIVRYEDWMTDRAGQVARVSDWAGLSLDPTAGGDFRAVHATTPTDSESVGRWGREVLPPAVVELFGSVLADDLTALGYPVCGPAVHTFRFNSSAVSRLVPSPHVQSLVADEHTLRFVATGPDAYFDLPLPPFPASAASELWLCVRAEAGDHASVYFTRAGEGYDESRCVHVPFHPGRHWQVVRLRVREHPRWNGTITRLRIDPCNGPQPAGATVRLRWLRRIEGTP